MEDMLTGLNEWRNIQDVVRKTFKQLHEIVLSQGQRIKGLERTLQSKAKQSDLDIMDTGLTTRPTFIELEKILMGYNQNMEQRVTSHLGLLNSKADKAEFKNVYQTLSVISKDSQKLSEVEANLKEMREQLKEVKKEVKVIEDTLLKHESICARKSYVEKTIEKRVLETRNELLEDVHGREEMIQSQIDTLEAGLSKEVGEKLGITDFNKVVSRLAVHKTVMSELEATRSQVKADVEAFKKLVLNEALDCLDKKADKSVVKELLAEKLGTKVFSAQMQEKLSKTYFEEKMEREREVLTKQVSSIIVQLQNEIVPVLNKKAFLSETNKLVEAKADLIPTVQQFDSKIDRQDVEAVVKKLHAQQNKDLLSRMKHVTAKKTSHRKLKSRMLELESKLVGLRPQLSPHRSPKVLPSSPIKEAPFVHQLQLTTSKIRDLEMLVRKTEQVVETTSNEVHQRLDELGDKLQNQQLKSEVIGAIQPTGVSTVKADLHSIKQLVGSELGVGRWIWKTGKTERLNHLQTGLDVSVCASFVPWNIQCVNSLPTVFHWERDSPEILISSPGLYEISFGVFTPKLPFVQVLVDGEPVLATNSASVTTGGLKRGIATRTASSPRASQSSSTASISLSKLKRVKHSRGNITGWTFVEFVALPPSAKLSFTYRGTPDVQGFLGLRKL